MMMATIPVLPNPRAARPTKPFTRSSRPRRTSGEVAVANRFSRPAACASPHLVDLAGRAVRLSLDVPVAFDAPLAAHHKMIGRWAAARDASGQLYTRMEARRRIGQMFDAAVLDILEPFKLAELRVVALIGDALVGDDNRPPALAVICDSLGQIELGWIEKSNCLRETAFGNVAPVHWQASAYRALVEALPAVLPIFDYDYLFEEIAGYYWDGETDDESARRCLSDIHGHSADDIEDLVLPSAMNARRPAWMLRENVAPLKDLPKGLADRIRRLRVAHAALVESQREDGSAWCCFSGLFHEYVPGLEDCSTLPPMTLVPFEHFGRELDDVGNYGMQTGFTDCAGVCPIPDVDRIDRWFASLRLGADLLLAAQALIEIDPAKEWR